MRPTSLGADRANALKIPQDFQPQKGAKKRKKGGFTDQVARILEQRINGDQGNCGFPVTLWLIHESLRLFSPFCG